jgi:tetratricopeptide (TPR) repeat protein
MWIIVIVAVWLALTRGDPESRWFARICLALFVAYSILLPLWFVIVPKHSLKLARGDRDRQRRILQWVERTPFGGDRKNLARFMLALNYQVAREYDAAEAGYRAILGDDASRLDPGFEAQVRLKLADTIEALGRPQEAEAQRKEAAASAHNAPESFATLDAQGRMLDREHRFAEAYAAYERALALAPANQQKLYVELMMRLVLSSFNAGRPADTLRWAAATIQIDPKGARSGGARRMAAVACAGLGRLVDAERYVNEAVELAANPKERSQSLAMSAEYMMRRGDLEGAERVAHEADAHRPGKNRLPWMVMGTIATQRGRLADAIEVLERAIAINDHHTPSARRRSTAVIQKDIAVLHAELGRAEMAQELLRQVLPALGGDGKLMVGIDVSAALIDALCNDRAAARSWIAKAEESRKDFPDDVATQRAALYHLARASLLVDEPQQAESILCAYLALDPDPVFRPYAYYHLAECRNRLGDLEGGREFDIRAASTSFGTRWEQMSRERIANGEVHGVHRVSPAGNG